MKEDILKSFKKEYQKRLKKEKEKEKRLNALIGRKTIMENSPLIKDYIELCAKIEAESENIWSDDEIFDEALYDFENKGLTDETNDIFIYAGTFYTEFGYEKKVKRDSNDAEFDKYIDIESLEDVDIPVEDRDAFEKNNRIIFLNEDVPVKYMLYEVREQFINDALSDGQEIACKKILSRYKKN